MLARTYFFLPHPFKQRLDIVQFCIGSERETKICKNKSLNDCQLVSLLLSAASCPPQICEVKLLAMGKEPNLYFQFLFFCGRQ